MIVVTTRIYMTKPKTNRTQYIWANYVIVDDNDEKCPVIEG